MPTKSSEIKIVLPYPKATPLTLKLFTMNYNGENARRKGGARYEEPNTLIARNQTSLVNSGHIIGLPRDNYFHTAVSANDIAMGRVPRLSDQEARAYNALYPRFRGKIYDGSAALGVTLGTYKESREMVTGRFRDLSKRADSVLANLATTKKPLSTLGSTHLEVVFGWSPLVADIQAATSTVIGNENIANGDGVKSHHRMTFFDHPYNSKQRDTPRFTGTLHATLGSRVQIHNLNVWLAERAGLLNGAAVAWDLVPWSFAINMFMNTGHLVNSVTDYTGLTFRGMYRSYRWKGTWIQTTSTFGREVHAIRSIDLHSRHLLGSPPRPSFQMKLPELNWGLAAIGASLFMQKLSAINRLVVPLARKLGYHKIN